MSDRGMMKWNSFNAITAHGTKLNKMIEERKKIQKPILSIDQLEEMNRILTKAIADTTRIKISYYCNGFIKKYEGVINKVDVNNKLIIFNNKKRVDLLDILNIEIV